MIRKKKIIIHAYVNHGFDRASHYFGISKNACFVLSLHKLLHDNKLDEMLIHTESKKEHINRVKDYSAKFMVDENEFIGPDKKGQPDLKMITADLYGEDAFVRKLENIAEEHDLKFAPFVRKALVYSMFKEGYLNNL